VEVCTSTCDCERNPSEPPCLGTSRRTLREPSSAAAPTSAVDFAIVPAATRGSGTTVGVALATVVGLGVFAVS